MRSATKIVLVAFTIGLGVPTRIARANPVFVNNLYLENVSAENVSVSLEKDYATVDGTYLFSLTTRGLLELDIPVIAGISDKLEDIARRLHIRMTGPAFELENEIQVRELRSRGGEQDLCGDLPKDLRIVMAVSQIGMTTRNFSLSIRYDQPLYNGVFYYLPITKPFIQNPDPNTEPRRLELQARITARQDFDVSIESPNLDATWSSNSVVIFLKHRRLVAARAIEHPSRLDREAPFHEIISGVRQCALHHVPLTIRENNFAAVWKDIQQTHPEKFEQSPNSFEGLIPDERWSQGIKLVRLRYETCPMCEEIYRQTITQQERNPPPASSSSQSPAMPTPDAKVN
jgi:hypothetical protein